MRLPSLPDAALPRRETLAAVALCASIAVPAFALDPNQPFDAYLATHFTESDGLYATVVDEVQQTTDGFLWLAISSGGLARFDGRNFDLLSLTAVFALAAGPDGDLWLGTTDGLTRLPHDTLSGADLAAAITYHLAPDSSCKVTSLCFDPDGVLWVGTTVGALRFDDGRFSAVGPRVSILEMDASSRGGLLLVTTDGFVELDRSGNVLPQPGFPAELRAGIEAVFHVMEDHKGDVWYSTPEGVLRRSGGRWQTVSAYGPGGNGAYRTHEDAQGNVWVAKAEGLFRATGTGLEPAVPKMQVRALCSDSDGNLWVGTNGDGLYRFKDPKARMFTTADGLPNDLMMTVFAAQDGTIWAGANCGGLARFDGTRFRTYDERDGLRNSCVWALAEDANHDLWIGTWGGGAFCLRDDRFTQILDGEVVLSIVAERDGSLWLATQRGLVRVRNGDVRTYTTADGLSHDNILKVFEDREGRILAGNRRGVDVLVGERFERLPHVPADRARPMGEDRSGSFFVELKGQSLTLRFQGGKVDTLRALFEESAVLEASSGDLWFSGFGIYRAPPHAFARPRGPDELLDYVSFGTEDGLAGPSASGGDPNMTLAADGTIWIATPHGLAVFDPQRLRFGEDPTRVYVRAVTVGREVRPAPSELVLPPGTSHVEVDFAAVEISSPEKIHMQYRLDGVDSEWLDAASSRRAVYSSIPPGDHALHIRARNGSGIWDRVGSTYPITQQPHFYQTGWFVALAVVVGSSAISLVHWLRVRQVARQLGARFDERLAERTRVARDLHDTFLQTIQGSKFVADHALKHPEDNGRLLSAVEQLAGWLGRATEEARAALNSLRASATERNDLADAFRLAVEECRSGDHLDASVSSTGGPRDLHPIVRDEIYRIGYEAIRNACVHSDAHALKVAVEHAHDLTLRIVDDGVGMDPALLEKGRQGHFGLSGMRERAERIGAKLTTASAPGSGTTVTVVVPGRLAYRAGSRVPL